MNYNRDFSKTWSGGLHAGYQAVTHYSMLNYWEWQASLTYKFEWLDLTVYYIQTDAKRAFYNVPNHSFKEQKTYLGRGELLIGVTKHF